MGKHERRIDNIDAEPAKLSRVELERLEQGLKDERDFPSKSGTLEDE